MCVTSYQCEDQYTTVQYISNRLFGQNLTWGRGGGATCMRKGCRAHLQRKVVVRDDAVMASTGSALSFVVNL
jgi:hypothetical protein